MLWIWVFEYEYLSMWELISEYLNMRMKEWICKYMFVTMTMWICEFISVSSWVKILYFAFSTFHVLFLRPVWIVGEISNIELWNIISWLKWKLDINSSKFIFDDMKSNKLINAIVFYWLPNLVVWSQWGAILLGRPIYLTR